MRLEQSLLMLYSLSCEEEDLCILLCMAQTVACRKVSNDLPGVITTTLTLIPSHKLTRANVTGNPTPIGIRKMRWCSASEIRNLTSFLRHVSNEMRMPWSNI